LTSPIAQTPSATRRWSSTATPCGSAGGDEDAVAAQLAAVVERKDVAVAITARSGHFGAEHGLDLFAAQHLAERFAERRRFAGKQVLGAVDQGRRAPEPVDDLRHLDPGRTAAENQ
jgi:hypothetical protein